MGVLLSIDGVTKIYPGGGTAVLDNVSVQINEGEFFTLLGPSGCGKTTLLRLIAGFEQTSKGDIRLGAESIVGKAPFQRPINTVFQSYALFPHLTVARNVGFGLEMKGERREKIDATVEEMLSLVRLPHVGERFPHQLSGGQQQRIALARALANRPRLLLLDESLSALDLKLRKEMQTELKRLQRQTGITFVFVTHDQEEALTMSDRIAVLNAGKIEQIGAAREIYDTPATRFVAAFIGDANLIDAAVVGGGGGLRLPVDSSSGAMPGKNATVVVRPEHIRLSRTKDGGSEDGIHLSVRVTDIDYVGTSTLYHVENEDGTRLRVRQQDSADELNVPRIGQLGVVFLPSKSCRVLPS
ncbi:spermidine/putrescine ABC transporter ATP-binding protein [Burkholderia paludis]|uniref:ABC transporter ATP-binding protein n=1 Tax=Burkholderia paludis TaxID=1506587 RepID=UPI0004DB675A|nr:ABC transporter ATP-binding protein [Burkholderia paludis]KFG98116.1 spermidine/putrescine ABC transporter ATP-binding protein [Burkholderia paludis]